MRTASQLEGFATKHTIALSPSAQFAGLIPSEGLELPGCVTSGERAQVSSRFQLKVESGRHLSIHSGPTIETL
jgi:hypothetical protein